MDGAGTLFGTLCGNTRNILQKITVELPKKHGRGGQSAMRFARLRLEKRHNYIRKVAELTVQHFITSDRPNVTGLVMAGSAEFKTKLLQSDLMDPRLKKIVIKTVDTSYGGENGFNQAIELSADALSDVKFVQEKKLISTFMDEISQDSGKYCFGVKDTLTALDMSAMETLIVWENLDIQRIKLRNNSTGEESVIHVREEEVTKDASLFRDKETGVELEVVEQIALVEWLAMHYKEFGAVLEFITDKSTEGAQFCRGFGGIGGLLRWRVDFMQLDEAEGAGEEEDSDFSDDDDADFDDLF